MTIYKEVALLSSVFNMAIHENIAESNPCQHIPKATRKKIWAWNERKRFLDFDEEQKLFEQLQGRRSHLAPLARFELETGLRRGELCRVEVPHVNLSEVKRSFKINGEVVVVGPNELLVERTKNGKPLVIPLSPVARRIAEMQLADVTTGKYLFTSSRTGNMISEIKTGFSAAVRDAGIEDFRFHDLRHTFATRLDASGASQAVIRDLLGHKNCKMTSAYTQTSAESRRNAIEGMARCRTDMDYGNTPANRARLRAVS